jgi:hypothetical protein
MSWVVGIEQRSPYEFIQIEVFEEESDAVLFAETYMSRRGHKLSKRTWRFANNADYVTNLVVRKRRR